MDANQNDILDLNGMINEIMREYVQAEEEVHLEPQPEKRTNVEPETQPEEEEQVVEERATKRKRTAEHEKKGEKDFGSTEARVLWNSKLADKGFIGERGFGKLISPFVGLIEKRGWGLFCKHKAPGFATLAREFYANMVEMRDDDTAFMRVVWVSFEHKRINEIFKLKDLKHGSKFKKWLTTQTTIKS